MRVSELIEQLRKMPQDAYVFHKNIISDDLALGIVRVKEVYFEEIEESEVHLCTLIP